MINEEQNKNTPIHTVRMSDGTMRYRRQLIVSTTQMTLQEAKDDVAKIHGFDNFQECYFMGLETSTDILIKYCDEAAEKYAQSQVNEAHNNAVEKCINAINKTATPNGIAMFLIEELKKLKR